MIRYLLAATVAFAACSVSARAQVPKPDKEGWYSLFNGKTLDGWKAAEFPKDFKVEDGLIVHTLLDVGQMRTAAGIPAKGLDRATRGTPIREFFS